MTKIALIEKINTAVAAQLETLQPIDRVLPAAAKAASDRLNAFAVLLEAVSRLP